MTENVLPNLNFRNTSKAKKRKGAKKKAKRVAKTNHNLGKDLEKYQKGNKIKKANIHRRATINENKVYKEDTEDTFINNSRFNLDKNQNKPGHG